MLGQLVHECGVVRFDELRDTTSEAVVGFSKFLNPQALLGIISILVWNPSVTPFFTEKFAEPAGHVDFLLSTGLQIPGGINAGQSVEKRID